MLATKKTSNYLTIKELKCILKLLNVDTCLKLLEANNFS